MGSCAFAWQGGKHRACAALVQPRGAKTWAAVCFHPVKITHALILLYFGFLLATLWWGPRFIQGPWLFLLRAFFPNWKFFHAVGHEPRLYLRWWPAHPKGEGPVVGDAPPAWHALYPRRPRSAWGLVHNPWVNLALSQQNLVDHLAHDLNHLAPEADARNLVAYKLVQAMVRAHCRQNGGAPTGSVFEFQIRLERCDTSGLVESHTLLPSAKGVV